MIIVFELHFVGGKVVAEMLLGGNAVVYYQVPCLFSVVPWKQRFLRRLTLFPFRFIKKHVGQFQDTVF